MRTSTGIRILQSRDAAGAYYTDADIYVQWNINKSDRTTVGTVSVEVDVIQQKIIGQFQVSGNRDSFKIAENSKTISKNLNINQDGNGPGSGNNLDPTPSYIFLSNRNITRLRLYQSANGVQNSALKLLKDFPLLRELINGIPQAPNWLFLNQAPSIVILDFTVSVAGHTNLQRLKDSQLVSLIMRGYNLYTTVSFFSYLPDTLYHFGCTLLQALDADLAQFFTGSRVSFCAMGPFAVRKVIYTGGAVFPSNLTEGEFKVPYILQVENNSASNLMTPTDFARFIVDFANQVTSVNLSNKIIRVRHMSPDTSYTDNSQPYFKTYSSAVAHVTGTLGITLQL